MNIYKRQNESGNPVIVIDGLGNLVLSNPKMSNNDAAITIDETVMADQPELRHWQIISFYTWRQKMGALLVAARFIFFNRDLLGQPFEGIVVRHG